MSVEVSFKKAKCWETELFPQQLSVCPQWSECLVPQTGRLRVSAAAFQFSQDSVCAELVLLIF